MASQKAHLLRCASSFVIAAYPQVRLIPQDLRALHLELLSKPSKFDELVKNPEIVMPDVIRHLELIELIGFRLSQE